MTVYISLRKL